MLEFLCTTDEIVQEEAIHYIYLITFIRYAIKSHMFLLLLCMSCLSLRVAFPSSIMPLFISSNICSDSSMGLSLHGLFIIFSLYSFISSGVWLKKFKRRVYYNIPTKFYHSRFQGAYSVMFFYNCMFLVPSRMVIWFYLRHFSFVCLFQRCLMDLLINLEQTEVHIYKCNFKRCPFT